MHGTTAQYRQTSWWKFLSRVLHQSKHWSVVQTIHLEAKGELGKKKEKRNHITCKFTIYKIVIYF